MWKPILIAFVLCIAAAQPERIAIAGPTIATRQDIRSLTSDLKSGRSVKDAAIQSLIDRMLTSAASIAAFYAGDADDENSGSVLVGPHDVTDFIVALVSKSEAEAQNGHLYAASRLLLNVSALLVKFANLNRPAFTVQKLGVKNVELPIAFSQAEATMVIKYGFGMIGREIRGMPAASRESFSSASYTIRSFASEMNALIKKQVVVRKNLGKEVYFLQKSEYSSSQLKLLDNLQSLDKQEISLIHASTSDLNRQLQAESSSLAGQ